MLGSHREGWAQRRIWGAPLAGLRRSCPVAGLRVYLYISAFASSADSTSRACAPRRAGPDRDQPQDGQGAGRVRQVDAQEGRDDDPRRRPPARRLRRARQEEDQGHGGLRVAQAGALLLAPRRRGRARLDRRRRLRLLQRVPRRQGAARDHAAHRPLLHHALAGARHVPRRRARGPRRHGQDRDDQGHGLHARQVRARHQLRRPDGLPLDGPHLQRPRAVGLLGLLRRVQQDRPRGALGGGAAGGLGARLDQGGQEVVPVHRRPGDQPQQGGGLLHHDEPGLRRPAGAAGEPQVALPRRDDDGARPPDHHEGEADGGRLQGERAARQEVQRALQAVRAAALQAAAL
eukprot:4972803-Prymnesium_polylepis.1